MRLVPANQLAEGCRILTGYDPRDELMILALVQGRLLRVFARKHVKHEVAETDRKRQCGARQCAE